MNIPSGTGANPAHKRQGSSSSFSVDINSLNIRLANLENFMFMAKLMQDDILVPSKLKDKMFDLDKINMINNSANQSSQLSTSSSAAALIGVSPPTASFINHHLNDSINSVTTDATDDELNDSLGHSHHSYPRESLRLAAVNADIHDHYKFILLIRNQFMQSLPFLNSDEFKYKELDNKHFKAVFDKMKYHYKELMATLDTLSVEAKAIMELYKEN